MSSVVISGDTSGAITLAAPAVSGTNTATLPAATGTVMVSGNMPAFSVYLSVAQNVTTGLDTKIQFNIEEFDTNNAFDNATNYRFTPQVAGYYQLNSTLTPSGTSVSGNFITVFKNGSAYKRICGINTALPASGGCILYLNGSTDYIEFYGNVTAVSGAQFYNGQLYTFASGSLIRAA
jgi:hypothetical protein